MAEVLSLRDFSSKSLYRPEKPYPYVNPPNGKEKNEPIVTERINTFDISQQEVIFDHLNTDGGIHFRRATNHQPSQKNIVNFIVHRLF